MYIETEIFMFKVRQTPGLLAQKNSFLEREPTISWFYKIWEWIPQPMTG